MNKDIKQELISAKNWILKNQKEDGEILWDDPVSYTHLTLPTMS